MNPPYLFPVDLAYLEIARAKPPRPVPAKHEPQRAELTRADVDLILQHRRHGTPTELQFILDHARQFHLSDVEKDSVSVLLTVTMAAARARLQGRPDQNAIFIHRVLGYAETPHGLLANRDWFEKEFKAGAVAISRCTQHRPPRCACWRDTRDILWQVQSHYGDRSPEAWAATSIYNSLEELELASRPERQTRMPTPLDFD